MKKYSILKLLSIISLIMVCNGSYAGNATLGPVYLDSVGIISSAFGGHQAGNLEIKITNGIGNPSGVSCDSNYITTRKTVESFQEIASILLEALTTNSPVLLGITDDLGAEAYPGRCSILYVVIQKKII